MNLIVLTSKQDAYLFDPDQKPRGGAMSYVYKGYRISDFKIKLAPQGMATQPYEMLRFPTLKPNRLLLLNSLPGNIINLERFTREYINLTTNGAVAPVAIKVLKRNLAQNQMYEARFLRESQIIIEHENVVKVHEYIVVSENQGKKHHITMEYLEGETLEERLEKKDRPPFTEHQALSLIRHVLEGLRAVHSEKHITHRDLKPGNLMCINDGSVKVMDFGIAKPDQDDASGGLTGIATFIGTPAYAAPEQVRMLNFQVGHHTDIWAVGAILYEILANKSPFEGRNDDETKERILNWPTPSVQASTAANAIIQKALQKDIARRYQHAEEMIADIDKILHPNQKKSPSQNTPASVPLPTDQSTKKSLPPVAIISIVIAVLVLLVFIMILNSKN